MLGDMNTVKEQHIYGLKHSGNELGENLLIDTTDGHYADLIKTISHIHKHVVILCVGVLITVTICKSRGQSVRSSYR